MSEAIVTNQILKIAKDFHSWKMRDFSFWNLLFGQYNLQQICNAADNMMRTKDTWRDCILPQYTLQSNMRQFRNRFVQLK